MKFAFLFGEIQRTVYQCTFSISNVHETANIISQPNLVIWYFYFLLAGLQSKDYFQKCEETQEYAKTAFFRVHIYLAQFALPIQARRPVRKRREIYQNWGACGVKRTKVLRWKSILLFMAELKVLLEQRKAQIRKRIHFPAENKNNCEEVVRLGIFQGV